MNKKTNIESMNTTIWVKNKTKKSFDVFRTEISLLLDMEINSDKCLQYLIMGFDEDKFKEKYLEKFSKKD